MLTLTITAGNKYVTFQDLKSIGTGTGSPTTVSLAPGETKSIVIPDAMLERVRLQLDELAASHGLTFSISGAETGYADGVLAPDKPLIDSASYKWTTDTGGDLVTIVGTNLIYENQVLAYVCINHDVVSPNYLISVGHIRLSATELGDFPNGKYGIEFIDSGSGGLAVSCTYDSGTGVRLITVNLGASTTETLATVAAAINSSVDSDLLYKMCARAVGVVNAPIKTTRTALYMARGTPTILANSGCFYFGTLATGKCQVKSIDVSAAPVFKFVIVTPDVTTDLIGTNPAYMVTPLYYINEGKRAAIDMIPSTI